MVVADRMATSSNATPKRNINTTAQRSYLYQFQNEEIA